MTTGLCDRCGEREAFDLYLGELVCRQCKSQIRREEYGFDDQ